MRSREEDAEIRAAWERIFARVDADQASRPAPKPCYRCGRCRDGLFAQCKALAKAGVRIVPEQGEGEG